MEITLLIRYIQKNMGHSPVRRVKLPEATYHVMISCHLKNISCISPRRPHPSSAIPKVLKPSLQLKLVMCSCRRAPGYGKTWWLWVKTLLPVGPRYSWKNWYSWMFIPPNMAIMGFDPSPHIQIIIYNYIYIYITSMITLHICFGLFTHLTAFFWVYE